MPKPGLIACVVRNGLSDTKRAVPTFRANNRSILIIDNASIDGTAQWLATQPDIYRIHLQTQCSLAACWNMACDLAFREYHCQDVLLVNSDVELRPDTYDWLSHEDYARDGMVSCVSVRTPSELRYPDPPTSRSFHPDFSCFLLKRWAYETLGEFDESYYPAYFEDNKAHVRFHRLGIHCVSIDLPFVHYGASTINQANSAEQYKIRAGADRNREKFRREFGCVPSDTEAYDALFTDSTFGIDLEAGVDQ